MNEISIAPLKDRAFSVEVRDGARSTRHQVTVPRSMLEDPELGTVDPQLLVEKSMEFLLEREPPTSILSEFSLDVIPRYFKEYETELRRRVST